MTDKTKSQTYNFLIENKTIEDIKQESNIEIREKSRHGGKTFKLIVINNTNNQIINDDLSENNRENLELVTSNLINNEKEQKINNDIWTKFKNYLNWPSSNTEELIQTQKKYIEQLEQSNLEKDKEIQQIKKENEKMKQSNESDINLTKYSYNAITIYDEKQRKKTNIDKIYEEILSIEDKVIFITTFVHIDNFINEKIICFQQLTNGDIKIFKQSKSYENINEYKEDTTLINDISTNKNKVSFKMIPIKEFLSEQEKLSNWKISKSEWIIFISLSLLSITLLAIPVAVPALVPIISTILWEKTLVSIVGIGIAWIVNKGIWTIATEKTKKVESWMKQSFYSLIRKVPFVNKRNLGKTKEELEIKKNVEKTIENLTSDKLETKLKTQYAILKQELDNRKDKNHKELISNETINYNSNNILENSSVEQLNPNNFDSSVRDTINQQEQQPSTSSNHNWNKVKCLLTT